MNSKLGNDDEAFLHPDGTGGAFYPEGRDGRAPITKEDRCKDPWKYQELVFRHTSPVKRKADPYRPFGLATLTEEERTKLLNLGALGLGGESGEVVDEIKKILFHGRELNRSKLIEECGDVLWYLACVAEAIASDIPEMMQANAKKVHERYPHGFKLGGGIREPETPGPLPEPPTPEPMSPGALWCAEKGTVQQ